MRSERLGPLSLRQRASLLYEGRRSAVLSEPVDAMRRAGLHSVIDPRSRHARSRIGHDTTVEVGFASSFRIFGALIDVLWTGKREGVRLPSAVIGYRFGRVGRFVPTTRTGRAGDVAEELNADAVLQPLLERAELKDVHLAQGPRGRSVQLRPLAGTITALYFPPLPPYTVLIRPDEADAQLALLTRLLTGLSGGPRIRNDEDQSSPE
jgi:hypothetical protein